jgi:hypothetical protein
MQTLTRTSVTGKQLTYQVIAYKIIGTKKYAICLRDGMQVLLPM